MNLKQVEEIVETQVEASEFDLPLETDVSFEEEGIEGESEPMYVIQGELEANGGQTYGFDLALRKGEMKDDGSVTHVAVGQMINSLTRSILKDAVETEEEEGAD